MDKTQYNNNTPSSIMEVLNKAGRSSSVRRSSGDNEEDVADLRRGLWTVDEDLTLINHIANHGEGRWNSLARNSGLKRTGKSCRLRWLSYLRPDIRRGNITFEEHLLILELHSQWGNQWSKIAQHLPGRTDNEIKNYWRTRVQKQTKQLKCDFGSCQFKEYLWMPRLVERIRASATNAGGNPSITSPEESTITAATAMYHPPHPAAAIRVQSCTRTDHENSCTTTSSSEYSNPFYAAHKVSDPNNNEYHPVLATGYGNSFGEEDRGNHQGQSGNFSHAGYDHRLNYGMEFQAMDDHQQQNHHDSNDQIQRCCWSQDGGRSPTDNLWNNVVEDVNYWFLQNSAFDPIIII